MMDVKEQRHYLSELGIRLKTLRLARNDTMAIFAQRLGVSAGNDGGQTANRRDCQDWKRC